MSNLTKLTCSASLFLLLAARPAQAQLHLQGLTIPSLPVQGLTQTVSQVGSGAMDRLSDVRRLQIDNLVRKNRRIIDVDPNGDPVVRSEILASSPSDAALDRAADLHFTVAREQNIESLGMKIVVLRAPDGMSTKKALTILRASDLAGTYDYNHVYSKSGSTASPSGPSQAIRQPAVFNPPRSAARIGLIDSGVDTNHAAFGNSSIETWGCAGRFVPAVHGTAVASLLVGATMRFRGVQPDAELFAADVYCDEPSGGAVDALAAAFGWMVEMRVAVVNVSLVGPKNALLERAIAALVGKGVVVVAAVGNDGPAAPPLYPASYPQVVGVTGVDEHRRVLLEAARGPQVMFAAPGADLAAADGTQGFVAVRGTSFAAPIVAGLISAELTASAPPTAAEAIAALARTAIDLGPAGRDTTYGFGVVGLEYRVDPGSLTAHEK